jgi:hypothetical protein
MFAGAPLTVTPASLGVTATDNCDLDVAIVAAPAVLEPGTTTVVCTAADDDGNESERSVEVTVLRGPLEVRVLRPLDPNVDNLIQAGRSVPVKVRVSCDNVFDGDATAVIDDVEQIDGTGTPVANDSEDDGTGGDDGAAMQVSEEDEHYAHRLSTSGWPTARGARFRVTIRVSKEGHADACATLILRNK